MNLIFSPSKDSLSRERCSLIIEKNLVVSLQGSKRLISHVEPCRINLDLASPNSNEILCPVFY